MRHLCVSRQKTPDSSSLGSDYPSNTTGWSSFLYSCCIYAEQASLTVLCYSNSSHFSPNKQSIISHKHPLSRLLSINSLIWESWKHTSTSHLFFTAQELWANLARRRPSCCLMPWGHETPTCLPSCPTLVCPLTTVLMLSSSRLVKEKTQINAKIAEVIHWFSIRHSFYMTNAKLTWFSGESCSPLHLCLPGTDKKKDFIHKKERLVHKVSNTITINLSLKPDQTPAQGDSTT